MKRQNQILLLAALLGTAHLLQAEPNRVATSVSEAEASRLQIEERRPASDTKAHTRRLARTPVPHHHRTRIGFRARPACPQDNAMRSERTHPTVQTAHNTSVPTAQPSKNRHPQRNPFALRRR